MRRASMLSRVALTLSLLPLVACGKGDTKSDEGAKSSAGDAGASAEAGAPTGGDTKAAKVPELKLPPADPKLVAAITAELDKVGDCKMGGEAAELDAPITTVTLKAFNHDAPQACEEKASGWEALADKYYGGDDAAKFKTALLANLGHPKAAARYYVLESLADFSPNADLSDTDLAALTVAASTETEPNLAAFLGEEIGMTKTQDAATAKRVGALLASTKSHELVAAIYDNWDCSHASCVGVVEAWATNPDPAIRAAGMMAASDLDEALMPDPALCKLTATGLSDKDGNMVATSARLLFEIGDACKGQYAEIFTALGASKGEAQAALFFEVWNNDPGDLSDAQNASLLDVAKAVKAGAPKNEDHASAAEDCIAAAE